MKTKEISKEIKAFNFFENKISRILWRLSDEIEFTDEEKQIRREIWDKKSEIRVLFKKLIARTSAEAIWSES